jgi:dCMP deaminase
MIINAGIKKIYYQSGYTDALAQEMLTEAGIDLIKHDDLNTQGGPP